MPLKFLFALLCILNSVVIVAAQSKPRARDLGIPFEGIPAANNAITDVPEVMVGYKTLIKDTGARSIRTGVTVILPRGKTDKP